MYYTIEGKRVLGILYIAGLITGTLFFNITIKMQVFKVSDFLDFTEYMKMLENLELAIFCSFVVLSEKVARHEATVIEEMPDRDTGF